MGRRKAALALGAAEHAELVAGAAALAVTLDHQASERLGTYAQLLDLWSRRVNLLACSGPRELVERHFLDSLALAPLVATAHTIVDLGSGAGLPGIPLAIVAPDREFTLIEARRRRTNFLREVQRTLGLRNVEILEGRAENGPGANRDGAFDAALCRAVWSDETALDAAARWLVAGGRFFWMRAAAASALTAAPTGRHATMAFDRHVSYRIAGRERAVEIYRRR